MTQLTADDVLNKKFQPTKFREGYDQDEVDEFLDQIVEAMRDLENENAELKAKLSPAQIDSTVQAVEEGLEGVGATLDIAVDEGRKRFDQHGQPVYKTDENGEPVTD